MTNYCPNCGCALHGMVDVCPTCGISVSEYKNNISKMNSLQNYNAPQSYEQNYYNQQPVYDNYYQSQPKKYNVLSIIGISLAGTSVFLNFWGIMGIAAVVLSIIALVQIQRTGENGKPLAIIGLVLGSLSILYAYALLAFSLPYLWFR